MNRSGRWRGLKALVHDAIDATTGLVDEGHASAARSVRGLTDRVPALAGPARAVDDVRRLSTDATLAAVRAVNHVVAGLTDLALDASLPVAVDEPPIPLRSDVVGTAAWIADAALGAVNGAIGDHLAAAGNGLDLRLVLRYGDRYLPAEIATTTGNIAVWIHGLGTTEWCWVLDAAAHHGDPAATFGTLLERDLGYAPVYTRYNTGRSVATNGAALADALEDLLRSWPVPVTGILLVGHSMGGLVARAACAVGGTWLAHVHTVISLGTPHQGAPLAQLGSAATTSLAGIDLPITRIGSRILDGRSAGVKDLDHGAGDAPLRDGIRHAFLSATITQDPEHPVGAWLGDLLVRVPSASGPRTDVDRSPVETGTSGGVLHHQMQCHPAVYARIRRLLTER